MQCIWIEIISFEQNVISYSSVAKPNFYAKIRLPSGNQRLISFDSRATLGTVAVPSVSEKHLGKAGRTRWLG